MRSQPSLWLVLCSSFLLSPTFAAEPMLAGGFYHSAVLLRNGTVFSFGGNTHGQMGNSTFSSSQRQQTPLQALLTDVKSIAIGDGALTTIALRNDGTVWTWGSNSDGQIGDGTSTSSYAPKRILEQATAVSAGNDFSLVLKADGSVWAWGKNGRGQLGRGTTLSDANTRKPAAVSGLSNIVSIAGCYEHALAVKSDGSVWGWGDNNLGELGLGEFGNYKSTPVHITALNDVKQVACGLQHSVVLKNDGTVWTFGNNINQQLGDGTKVDSRVPKMISGLSGVTMIAAAENTSLALRNDGTVWGWGSTERGQVGAGAIPTNQDQVYAVPTQISGLSKVIRIARGYHHSLAITADGNVWAWGWNDSSQLADGSETLRHTPVAVLGLGGVGQLNVNAVLSTTPFPVSAVVSGRLENLGLRVFFSPLTEHQGSAQKLFVAAMLPSGQIFLASSKAWLPFEKEVTPYASVSSLQTAYVDLLNGATNLSGLAGTVILLGYGTDATELLNSGRFGVVYTVQ